MPKVCQPAWCTARGGNRSKGHEGKAQEEHGGGKVEDRDAGWCTPARGKATDDTLDHNRPKGCRREQTPTTRDARRFERSQCRCRREGDDCHGDDSMCVFDEGFPPEWR
jgi:hypothetical protein